LKKIYRLFFQFHFERIFCEEKPSFFVCLFQIVDGEVFPMGTIKEESNPFSDEAKKIVQEILEEMLVRVLEKPEYEQQMVNHLSIHLYIRELEIIEDICTSLFSLSLSPSLS